MGEIRDYSITADDNNSTPPAGAPEGMSPSTVNNTMREAYARIKRWYDDAQGAKTTAGSSNTYTLAAARTVASYAAGDNYVIKANHSNTGAATLNVDSVGAKAIVTPALNALEADSIRAGGVYQIAYEASADKFILVNGAHPSESQITLKNPTSEDTSGGRESQVVFKGLQSGGEETALAKIQASHEGTSDDEKGQLIVGVNDGNDGASPTTAVTIASTGQVTFSQKINPPHPARNYLVNGDFAVSQRLNGAVATSATTPANSDDTVLIDRWILLSDGNDIVDVGRSVANRTDMQYIGYNVVETPNEKFGFAQIIENRDAAQLVGGSAVVTLSFIAAVNDAATGGLDDIRAGIVSWSGTADSVTSDLVSAWNGADTNPTLATNWTFENTPANLGVTGSFARYSVTATIDTSSTTNVAAFIWSNSVDNDVDDIFYLGGCQLELGSYPTPFITESYEENLARCQRYYRIVGLNTAAGNSSNNMYYTSLDISPSMNHDPTIAASFGHGLYSGNSETRGTSTFGSGVNLIDSTPESVVVRGGTSSSYNWIRGDLHLEAEL